MEMMEKDKRGKVSQDLIPVSEIRNGILVLKDSTMRAVLMVSSVNFALKAANEQDAIIYAYQDFINSLDFPIQITVTSRKMDITPYIEQVKELKEKQENELLRLQMSEYINFIGDLVKESNIMTKTFFITVPFAVTESKKEGFFERFMKGAKGATGKHKMSDEEFARNEVQLMQRVEQVALGLQSFGLRVVPLQTQELLEMLYGAYNPRTSQNQRLKNVGALRIVETEQQAE